MGQPAQNMILHLITFPHQPSSTKDEKAVVEVAMAAARLSPLGCLKVKPNTRSEQPRRRHPLLLSSTAFLADSRTDLLDKYLKKSEESKAKNDKERLDSYYKRNYGDYFRLLEGDLRQKKELSESEKGILEWLDKNR